MLEYGAAMKRQRWEIQHRLRRPVRCHCDPFLMRGPLFSAKTQLQLAATYGILCPIEGDSVYHLKIVKEVLGLLSTQLLLSQDGAMGPWAVGHTGYLQMKAAK